MYKNTRLIAVIFLVLLLFIGIANAGVAITNFSNTSYTGEIFTLDGNEGNTTSWNVPAGVTTVYYFVVGGGAGGGGSYGGAGGAGGVVNGSGLAVSGTETIIVGEGGVGTAEYGLSGLNSSLTNDGATIVGNGGGGGGAGAGISGNGFSGGSGGGGGGKPAGITTGGVGNQGTNGGNGGGSSYWVGGGGGGKTVNGTPATDAKAGNGGAGIMEYLTGFNYIFAGGGGGGCNVIPAGTGGSGVGGDGSNSGVGSSAIANTGSGGGGGGPSGSGGSGSGGVVIVAWVSGPVANFAQNQTAGLYPLTVAVNDTSTGSPTLFNYSIYATGSFPAPPNYTTQNFTHLFSTGGNYTINQTVGISGGGTSNKIGFVEVLNRTLAAFTANQTSGQAPLAVQFTDMSSNATDWYWEFGEGNISSSQNPLHIYEVAGIWTVSLKANNSVYDSDFENKTAYITVTSEIQPIAISSISRATIQASWYTRFNDTSLNSPTAWCWTFQDGTFAATANGTKRYTRRGIYNISSCPSNGAGSNCSYNLIRVI